MYSQYSYYQNNSAPSPQQPQQHQAPTTTSGQVWNGQQWTTTTTTATAAPSYAQAAAATTVANNNQIIKYGKTHTELVQHYTSHYHHWNTQSTSSKAALTALPPPHPNTPSNNAQREEMERREKWASYYASNSAALAHYHLGLSKGGGEPYARPASPPAPPTGAAGGGVGIVSGPVTTAEIGAAAVTTISTTTNSKKKSRWASVQVQDSNNHGKLSTAAGSAGNGATTTAAAVEKKNVSSNNNNLYLNKFVQEKLPKSNKKLEGLVAVNNFSATNKAAQYPSSASAGERAGGGTKRKLTTADSSLSAYDGHYGPSSSDDYVPFALNQPLGASKKEKKPKKKQAKKAAPLNNGMSGFDADRTALSERAHRFKGKGGIHDVSNAKSTADDVDKYMGKGVISGSKKQLDENDYERMTVKGTCQTLEKEYLRLTSPPRVEFVRPQSILKQHLSNLKESYKAGKVHNGRHRDYDWYCSQFKALRQDLTVQRIINAFSVDVYETHAKVALEEDDINEYNQSQTQLKELYDLIDGGRGGGGGGKQQQGVKQNGKGKNKQQEKDRRTALKNQNEFIAYRIIYYVFLSGNRKYEGGSSDIFKIMLQLTSEQRKDECIHHALLVRAAVAENDYHKFFQLQDAAPNMSDYLMDKIVPSVRQGALQRICKAYRPSVSAEFVLKELGFDIRDGEEVEGAKAWMEGCGCRFQGGVLMTKDMVLKESVGGVKNSLI